MASREQVQSITLPAAADLSASQYRFVDVNSSGQAAVVASAGAKGVGVLSNKPLGVGQAATVDYSGVTKVVTGSGGLTAGNKVQSDASGGAIVAASGDHVFGIALKTTVENELCPILLISQHVLA